MNYVPNHVPFVVVSVEPQVILPVMICATLVMELYLHNYK